MKSKDKTVFDDVKATFCALVQFPLHVDEAREILYALKQLGWYLILTPVLRVLALVLFPVSVPFFVWCFRQEREREAVWRANMRTGIHRNGA